MLHRNVTLKFQFRLRQNIYFPIKKHSYTNPFFHNFLLIFKPRNSKFYNSCVIVCSNWYKQVLYHNTLLRNQNKYKYMTVVLLFSNFTLYSFYNKALPSGDTKYLQMHISQNDAIQLLVLLRDKYC
jgi:hypothetical protein